MSYPSARRRIHELFNDTTTPVGRALAWSIQTLIVVSILTYSLETLPDLTPRQRFSLELIEKITVVIFTIEYLIRIWATPNRIRYATSFYGLIDLAAILPFWLATGFDFRYARILRLLRLFRILKLTRYTLALRRFERAMRSARDEIIVYLCLTSMLIFLAAAGIYHFENEAQPEVFSSIFAALWWSLATLTTVGYGDAFPVTTGGKCFTALMLLVGLGVVAVPTGLVASALSEAREMAAEEKRQDQEKTDS
ncbi:MAG: ion transporter [Planctomycetota bacterium]